ncbi:hypothetical protein K493DRAFT_229323 [Basidiobolus meristosporus CBS 931.73]|uniref:Ion transport domain-containing protein n=1 Tax=Basidiobolus meristosporus CBS 931.73 TaxID=1314790 RepID=A0A1Y1XYU4_9FUNG|nr:hypothetical protein K493DRAFT_229323 [Basidiobolus meristosporus CBS 931.73]|eukprot:ORX90908.1 hypothetical protein K493DRAFT_229323 [Basidiobolus meristosporus CBS 931.73]
MVKKSPEEVETDTYVVAITRRDLFRNLANRIVYSKFYTFLYILLAVLSLISVVLVLFRNHRISPGLEFFVLEIIINLAMLFEVIIRMVALGKTYWKSLFNILDVVLMMFCLATLILLFLGCSPFNEKEELVDTVFLVIRNIAQFWRLLTTVQK